MHYIQIQAGEGGDDAKSFAETLTQAIQRWAAQENLSCSREDDTLLIDGHCL